MIVIHWLTALPVFSAWLAVAVKASHTVLYLFLIALPLMGWYPASQRRICADKPPRSDRPTDSAPP